MRHNVSRLLLLLSLLLSCNSQLICKTKKVAKPTDSQVVSLINQIKGGKLPTSVLGSLGDLLRKLGGSIIAGDVVGIKTANLGQLPIELSPKQAVALSGTITFLKQPVDCKVIIGKEIDAMGKSRMGFSLDIALSQSYKVKDLNFLKPLGVPDAALGPFGSVDLPQPHLIFSTFDSYTDPESDTAIEAGITLSTKTKVTTLLSMVRKEINNLTGGNANKLPFLANTNDSTPVQFNIAIGFKGTNFKGLKGEIALPLELGIDLAKLRAQERRFRPKIKAPFDDLNKPIKEVTGILNKAPLNGIKKISVGNFIASLGIAGGSIEITFSSELNVTTNNNTRYGMKGTVGLTPSQLAIELQKSPSIKSMPLGAGVSIENIALATYTDFKLLASTGVPISGLGLLGEIKFPFEGDKVTIGLAGKVEMSGDFMLMGNVKNLDTKKIAVFNAQLIENLAKAVNFDTSALTKAMKQMPKIVIKDGLVYVSTKETTLGGRTFPMGLGVSLDTLINNMKAKLAVAGNTSELSFMGYISQIRSPYIVISGAGPDKKHGTGDDGPLIDFQVSADDPMKAKFFASSRISLPPVKLSGQGDLALGVASIDASFKSKLANLFSAEFEVAFDPRNIPASKIGFDLDTKERGQFITNLLKKVQTDVTKGISKILPGAAGRLVMQRFPFIFQFGTAPLKFFGNSVIPKRVYAKVLAKTWSGSFGMEGGALAIPGLGKIDFGKIKMSFSLKEPAKVVAQRAEQIAKDILEELVKAIENIAGMAWDLTNQAAAQIARDGKKVIETAKKTGKSIEKAAVQVKQETEIAAKAAAKKAKELSEKAASEVKKGAEKVGKGIVKGGKAAVKKTKEVIKDIGDFFGF